MSEEYGHLPDGFFLSPSEIEELRKQKQTLTKYGQDKIRKLINQKALELSVESVVEYETKELEEK